MNGYVNVTVKNVSGQWSYASENNRISSAL